jgi:hypothetical protein
MVLLAATCGNRGSYTLNNSFIEGTDQQMASSTGVTGRKSATGANETPSATYSSTINRQMIIGLVVKATGGTTPTLSVSPTSVSVAAAAGSTGTFNITSSTSWTVSDNQSWLTVSPTSGSNNATVTVTAQANTGSARTATVTVSATGVASQTVTVTQAAGGTTPTLSVSPTSVSVAAAAGSTGTFNITSNTSWTVSDDQSWLTVSPTSGSNNAAVTVTAQENTGSTTRSATVTVSATGVASQTVTVTQAAAGVSTSVWLESECASVGSLWNIVSDSTASNSYYATIQSGNNSTGSAPTNSAGYIDFPFSITTSGTYYMFARVKCPTGNDDSFWVRMDGGSWVNWNNITATSWTWKQFTNTFSLSTGSHTLTFAYREDGAQLDKINLATSSTLPTGTGSTASNLCTPEGTILSVSPTSVSVAAAAGSTGTFSITSNTSWTVSDNQTWLTVSPTSGSDNTTVTVTAQENTDTSTRSATVTVSATGAASQTVTVTQAAGSTTPTLSVSPTSVSVAAAAGSTGTFNITSNTSWTVSDDQSWLTVSPTSGLNNATVTVTAQENEDTTARTATVTVSGTGVASKTVAVTQSASSGGDCTIPAMPSYSALPTNAYLPDPFMFMDGHRMTTKAEWECRRAEIAAQVQEYELGYMPDTPYSATTGSYSSNTITVNVTDNGKTISFSCSITYPSTGSAPYPAMIGIGGNSLNTSAIQALGVALITFPNDTLGQQNGTSSRGVGKFYDMYGSGHSASAMMAWAWGVDRLIDAIEKTPACNIDPTRLSVTGCSRNGKGALIAGAFCERIALTLPQEGGSGGAASWRVSDWQKAQGTNVQTLSQIVTENVWFRANFSQFSSTATKLPFDHHMVEALCAPRALLVIENTTHTWLGNISTWTTGNAAHKVWEALEIPDKMGFSQVGNHTHCAFPSSQQPEVTAYVQKFLVGGGTGNTTIMYTDGGLTFDEALWVNWTVPDLQ